ncbi:hypothetical protein SAMN05414139_00561 [Burkholderia sp. D7]|nr:hypothetical protein SAMN05414139_00561 [Burkholderia sp. D7]
MSAFDAQSHVFLALLANTWIKAKISKERSIAASDQQPNHRI